jgi:(p)ppGpp synthase/HD superfamily hydrolase
MVTNEDILKALSTVMAWQGEQKDIGGHPYMGHIMRVMGNVIKRWGYDPELICIAIYHDLLEDTEATSKALIDNGVSHRVYNSVQQLTRWKGEEYEDYIGRLMGGGYYEDCIAAMKVKVCDLEDNMDVSRLGRRLTPKDNERLDRYKWASRTINKRLREFGHE